MGKSQNGSYKKAKARQIFRKTNTSNPLYADVRVLIRE